MTDRDIVDIRARFEQNHAWFESVAWLKADIEALLLLAEWKPIATAPKDGTRVLLDWSDREIGSLIPPEVGFWHASMNAWCDTHRVLHGQGWDQQPKRWRPLL